ncbi:MAG: DUF6497 family protein [Roseinatronobacter sp.]
MLVRVVALLGALAAPAGAEALRLPSGNDAAVLDQIWDEDMDMIRLRYIVPKLAEPPALYLADGERVFSDMQWLCEQTLTDLAGAGQDLAAEGWRGAIVTLLDRPLDFGQRDPSVVQVFESFVFGMDGCDWDDEGIYD